MWFRVWGLGFGFLCSGDGLLLWTPGPKLGFRVKGLGFRVQGLGFRVQVAW